MSFTNPSTTSSWQIMKAKVSDMQRHKESGRPKALLAAHLQVEHRRIKTHPIFIPIFWGYFSIFLGEQHTPEG